MRGLIEISVYGDSDTITFFYASQTITFRSEWFRIGIHKSTA